nr:dTDP-4-dehydrorhamnose reductase [Hyphomicrobium methylovorum]
MLVTGKTGQVATALKRAASNVQNLDVITIGRPEWDLARADIAEGIAAIAPNAIVNAAAYTGVDKAESEPEVARAINATGAGFIAAAAAELGVPVIQISTDYVFDGSKPAPYVETDGVAPLGVYGQSKWLGEEAVRAASRNHAILRTSWIYGPAGTNFLRTMLRLARTHDQISVIDDQVGAPTFAADIGDAIIEVARQLVSNDANDLRGTFHLASSGATTWARFAEAIFELSAEMNGPTARVKRITTSEYPTAARRPANSRLDTSKLERCYGIEMPAWRDGLARCMQQLSQTEDVSPP